MIPNTFQNRVLGKTLFGVVMLACALWGAHGKTDDAGARSASAAQPPLHGHGERAQQRLPKV